MKKICILNSGCGAHTIEFRKLLHSLEGIYELTNFPSEADLIIQYFCSITQTQITKISDELAYLSKIKKENAILIICGCAPKVLGTEIFSNLDFVDYVIGRENISENIIRILNYKSIPGYYLGDNTSSFIFDIVGGCRKKGGWCTFCKQNFMKIPVKSMKMEDILEQTENITKNTDIYRICLTGLNICNYGIDMKDKKQKLHLLIKKLSEIPSVKVIDLFSLTVADMYEELIEEISTNTKIRTVELGIQSGCDNMLKIMNTSSTKEYIQMLLNRLSHKAIKSIVVVGHPGETKEYLQETLDFISVNNLWYVQISPFVSTEGTPSHIMEPLSKEDYKYNVKTVEDTVWKLKKDFLDGLIGSTMYAYIEGGFIDEQKDTAHIYMESNEHLINFTSYIENFSTSKYKAYFDKLDPSSVVTVKIKEIIDYQNATFEVKLLEEIDNESNI